MLRPISRLAVILSLVLAGIVPARSLPAAVFIRGDVDVSGLLDVTDPINVFGFLFLGGKEMSCLDAADANDSGQIDISDGVYLLEFLFKGGPEPPPPFTGHGTDPTEDNLECGKSMNSVHHWNQIAIDASGLDHMPPGEGEDRVFREQMGPGRASRAIAIVQIAVFEAVNAIDRGHQSYVGLAPAAEGASMDAAVAQAAHDTLASLFPAQAASFDARLAEDLARIEDGSAKTDGIDLGQRAAAAILERRAADGSQHAEPVVGVDFITSNEPGKWRQDPISQIPLALGAFWGGVTPFVMSSSSQFRVPPPPALDSPEYADAYNEVKRLGGDGITTPTEREKDETEMGIFWAYDGTPSLCAPPRLYNQITVQIADQMGTDTVQLARLLALVNVAMADAGIGIWESKYHYQYWRPITGIREADAGTGPTGAGDGNPLTEGDPAYSPLGAPASNAAVNFTPPFPAYPSGHAGFGGALFQTLRNFYGTDDVAFSFISDEYNGMTLDASGYHRPVVMRHFTSLSQAEEENGQSRIYLGIHWSFDKTEGIAQGRRIADLVSESLFLPKP